jgi:hypothetical protein
MNYRRTPPMGFDKTEVTRTVRHPEPFGQQMICLDCLREAVPNAHILFHAPKCESTRVITYSEYLDKEGIPF